MKILAILLMAMLSISSFAADRSASAVREFKRAVPCPETGVTRGACPGWQVDHIVPLCAGGADKPANMQWLLVEEHKAKTRVDVRACRVQRKSGN